MLVNSCYVSRGVGVRKVTNSKSDLKVIQGYAVCWDFIQPTCVQNFITLALAVPEIWLVPTKI